MNSVDLLLNRQSNPLLAAPAPTEEHLDLILKAGMRVPDHGGLQPWHFTVFKENRLALLSDIFVEATMHENADESKQIKAKNMPFRAPLIIVVATQYQEHEKVPNQEQLIAAGCCVHAMQMAAFAMGYGAMWRTGAMSYNTVVKEKLNVGLNNDIVGFLYIGSIAKSLANKKPKPYLNKVTYF